MNIELTITKKGLPALWESGGGATNTGSATIIAGPNGEKLAPIYIKRSGSLSCGQHALFVVQEGYYVVMASHWRRDFTIKVYQIVEINLEAQTARLSQLYEYSQGEWNYDPPAWLKNAIDTAMEKAICYHCREPHYIL